MTRSRAWLAVPAVPLVLLAGLIGGPVPALAVAVASMQMAVLWRGSPAAGAAVRAAIALGRGPGDRSVPALLVLRVLPATVGVAVVLLTVDWAMGALWDGVTGRRSGSDAVVLATADLPPARDERAHSEAYAGSPWVERYFAELEAVPFTYVPFLGPRERSVHGRYINSMGGVRASYEPPGAAGEDALEVWFFGGSTLWGEGQRDGHTIPSEVARLAERDGLTLRVVNFGERGYTAFQEFLVFERELARRPSPDVAVFYHGANELYSLLEAPENLGDQPQIYQLGTYDEAFHRAPPLPGRQASVEPSVLEAYRRTGLVDRVGRWLGDQLVPPAQAQDAPYQAGPASVARALDAADQIYRRSVHLVRHQAASHGVASLVFWQPAGEPAPSGPPLLYAELGDRVVAPTRSIDISDALVDAPSPVYIDGLHTNELGARMSAEAIWGHLAPQLAGRSR